MHDQNKLNVSKQFKSAHIPKQALLTRIALINDKIIQAISKKIIIIIIN